LTIPAIQIEGVQKHFGSLQALKGLDLTVQQGEFFGLLGPNGAGKSTLINILAGLLRPTAGKASVMGHDVVSDYQAARMALGVVPQELVFDPFFNVREMLRFQAGYFGRGKENDAWHKPPVIVLDEPTAGVDVELRQLMWSFIRRLNQDGHTIILTTHYLEEAEELCSRVAMMKQGAVVALDTTANLLKTFAAKNLCVTLANDQLPASLQGMLKNNEGNSYTLTLTEMGQVEHVLSELRKANVVLEDMQIKEADLEDVFLSLVGGA